MKQEIINKIVASDLTEEVKSKLINGLTERHVMKAFRSEVKMGDSKMGGFPHLPKNVEYPQEETFYYEFVAQINIADLVDCNIPDFPREGILYFFIDDDFNAGNVNAKVFLHKAPVDELEIKSPPANKTSRCESFSDRTEKTELKLSFTKNYTTDQHLVDEIFNQNYGKETTPDSFKIEDFHTRDQVGGYTTTWGGGDADWSAYLAKKRFQGLYWFTVDHQVAILKEKNIDFKEWLHGKVDAAIAEKRELLIKYDPSLTIYPYWKNELSNLEFAKLHLEEFIDNFEHHKSESKKWKMLFSMSSYSDAHIKFGDGKMEFFIHSDDLKNKNFDNIYCHIYN